MSIAAEQKHEIISGFAVASNDTGSPEVQCAVITERIRYLSDHLQKHRGDFQTKRGLVALIVKRKRLLAHLKRRSIDRYNSLIKRLNLKK